VIAVAFAATAVVASTAVAVSQWYHSAVVKPRVTEHEYAGAQNWLTLPPGASWPEFKIEPNTVTGKGGGASRAVTVSKEAWECYWVGAIRRQDEEAERRAQAELERLLADNVVVAPTGAPEDWAPSPAPKVPYAIWANDGGLEFTKKMYAEAAAGRPQMLAQSCRANR